MVAPKMHGPDHSSSITGYLWEIKSLGLSDTYEPRGSGIWLSIIKSSADLKHAKFESHFSNVPYLPACIYFLEVTTCVFLLSWTCSQKYEITIVAKQLSNIAVHII